MLNSHVLKDTSHFSRKQEVHQKIYVDLFVRLMNGETIHLSYVLHVAPQFQIVIVVNNLKAVMLFVMNVTIV